MNFRNILWKYAPREDGSCDVKLYFNHLGKKKYFSLDIKIQPKYWNKTKGEVKKTHPLANRYNGKINRLRLDIETHFLDGGSWPDLFNEKEKRKGYIIEFLIQIIKEGENKQLDLNSDTLKSYKGTLRRLHEFKDHSGVEITMQRMDMTFYSEFTSYLYKYANCNGPGVNGHIKILKRLMNIGLERNMHTNTIHQKPGFKRPRLNAKDSIYISEDEVALLENLDLSKKKFLEKELDRWLIAYHFILRFSDLKKVTKESIQETNGILYFKHVSNKTSTPVAIPVKKRVVKILEKYNYNFTWGGNPQANRQIKEAVAMAGINEMIEINGTMRPKSSLVTMHTARRSAATNLYLTGNFSLKVIADLGGWRSIRMLQVYLRCSNMDSAMLAAQSDYFK